jgi:hypothetical protein
MQHKTTSFCLLSTAFVFMSCGGNNSTNDAAHTLDTTVVLDTTPVPDTNVPVPDASVPVPDAGTGSGSGSGSAAARSFLYLESNGSGSNDVLAFAINDVTAEGSGSASGTIINEVDLSFVGATATGGKGLSAGADQAGPLNSAQQVISTATGQFLFAVNSGDDTVSSFAIGPDGQLTTTAGSPFNVGGANPASLGIIGSIMFIAEKEIAGKILPRYAAAALSDGKLALLANRGAAGQAGGSPTVVYISPDRKLVFGTEFFDAARPSEAPVGQIDVFLVGAAGKLTPAPGSPHALPPDNTKISPTPPQVALGVISNPAVKVLYVAFPTRAQIGVYTYTDTGTLTFVRTVSAGKDVCCFAIDPRGRFLYAVNTGSATVTTYSLAVPTVPVALSRITLEDAAAGPPFVDSTGTKQTLTSLPSQVTIDATGQHLYVLSQRVTTNATDPKGNLLHVLDIGVKGRLTEDVAPTDLAADGVPSTARPQGLVIVTQP